MAHIRFDIATRYAAILTFLALSFSHTASARNVYLNGVDVSGARGQELKNVTVKISDNGDIYVTAPHYRIEEETTYTPLSEVLRRNHQNTRPGVVHQQPGAFPATASNNTTPIAERQGNQAAPENAAASLETPASQDSELNQNTPAMIQKKGQDIPEKS